MPDRNNVLNHPKLAFADVDTREDLEYVSTRIQELINAFNNLNRHKGFELLAINFNAVSGETGADIMTQNTLH